MGWEAAFEETPVRRANVVIAAALLLQTSLAYAAPASHEADCSSAPWPPNVAPDVLQLALTAEREAAASDAAAQWLRGSLYLFGLGVPKDRYTGIKWIETATRTAIPAIRPAMPDPPSEMELFSMLLSTAEKTLPEMVQRDGAAWGVASFKQSARTLIQALSGCMDNPPTRR